MLKKLRQFLVENDLDYLLINSTNEFLLEYNKLENNSRYLITNFSGSTGEAVLSKDNLYLFVDGRYHEQADNEVNHDFVQVVKLDLSMSLPDGIINVLKPDTTLAVTPSKVSLNFFNLLKNKLEKKNIKIKELGRDFISQNNSNYSNTKTSQIPWTLTGKTADEKFLEISKSIEPSQNLLISNIEDVAYLTNLRGFDIEYSSSFYSKAIVTKEKALVFVDNFKDKIGDDFEIHPLGAFDKVLDEMLVKNTIGVFPDRINLKDFRKVESRSFLMKENPISKLRSIKTAQEIEHLKDCFKKTDIVMQKVFDIVACEKEISEQELSTEIEKEFYKQGSRGLSFKTILASGQNTSIIHYSSPKKDKIIRQGELILIDMGAYFEGGLATDITRTIVFGSANERQKQLYTTVLRASLNLHNLDLKSGVTGYDLDKKARELLVFEDYKFSHSLGHGVGIGVHEAPPHLSLGESAKTKLEPNMCFTIEPGLYKPDCDGVRLENTVYLTEDYKIQSLSKSKFDEKLIDFSVLNQDEKKWLKDWQEGLI